MSKATKTVVLRDPNGTAFSVQYEETVEGSGVYQPLAGVVVELSEVTVAAVLATKMGTILTGTVGASGAAIGTTQACRSVLLLNTHATLTLLWGNSTTQPVTLGPGAQQIIPASNVTEVYVKDGTGHATWIAIPEVLA